MIFLSNMNNNMKNMKQFDIIPKLCHNEFQTVKLYLQNFKFINMTGNLHDREPLPHL